MWRGGSGCSGVEVGGASMVKMVAGDVGWETEG